MLKRRFNGAGRLCGFDSAITRTAVAAADLILSPFHDDPSDILGLIEFSQVLEEISIKMGKTLKAHIVMNKVHPCWQLPRPGRFEAVQ
jgi:cellulose biosynthesis protein BcsQ